MKQRGFTLLETIVAIGVMSLLVPVLGGSIYELVTQSVRNNSGITALTSMENAARWLTQDIPIAQDTDLADGSWADMLQLEWMDWSDSSQYDAYSQGGATYKRNVVTYLVTGSVLERQHLVCSNWSLTSNTCLGTWTNAVSSIAREIAGIRFSRSAFIFTIESTFYLPGTASLDRQQTYRFYAALLSSRSPV